MQTVQTPSDLLTIATDATVRSVLLGIDAAAMSSAGVRRIIVTSLSGKYRGTISKHANWMIAHDVAA